MSPFLAEFIGTAVMIVLGNGSVANVVTRDTKGAASGWIVITTGWALAVFVGVLIAGPYSGAHLNPAVTLGVAAAGNFPWVDVLPYAIAQLTGAFFGAVLVWLFYHDHIQRTNDKGVLQAMFCTAPAIRNYPINFFC
ncbi:MAG: MIP/aquaporin family protein, partial [Rikenellaceae bacterium]